MKITFRFEIRACTSCSRDDTGSTYRETTRVAFLGRGDNLHEYVLFVVITEGKQALSGTNLPLTNFNLSLNKSSNLRSNRTGNVLQWHVKPPTTLSLYKRTIFNGFDYVRQPSSVDADSTSASATWYVANQDICCVTFSATAGSAFPIRCRFERKALQGRP